MILFQEPIVTKVSDYINKTTSILDQRKLSVFNKSKLHEIRSFVDTVVERLKRIGDCQMQLVFTHGDFRSKNMLHTNQGLKVIDWETAAYRSTLHDFYNYFFHILRQRKTIININSEINEALLLLKSRLSLKLPNVLTNSFNRAHVLRWLYYIERVCTLVVLAQTENQISTILRNISLFRRFEEMQGININHIS